MRATTIIFEEDSGSPLETPQRIIYPNKPHASALHVEEIDSITFQSPEDTAKYHNLTVNESSGTRLIIEEQESDNEAFSSSSGKFYRGVSITSATTSDDEVSFSRQSSRLGTEEPEQAQRVQVNGVSADTNQAELSKGLQKEETEQRDAEKSKKVHFEDDLAADTEKAKLMERLDRTESKMEGDEYCVQIGGDTNTLKAGKMLEKIVPEEHQASESAQIDTTDLQGEKDIEQGKMLDKADGGECHPDGEIPIRTEDVQPKDAVSTGMKLEKTDVGNEKVAEGKSVESKESDSPRKALLKETAENETTDTPKETILSEDSSELIKAKQLIKESVEEMSIKKSAMEESAANEKSKKALLKDEAIAEEATVKSKKSTESEAQQPMQPEGSTLKPKMSLTYHYLRTIYINLYYICTHIFTPLKQHSDVHFSTTRHQIGYACYL